MAKKRRAAPEAANTRPASKKAGVPEQKVSSDRPISDVYPVIDNDLARDNLENDLTEADLQDL